MHIIALAWIYVVSMMAITETSVIAAIMTFTCYCVIPLGIVWYITNNKKRKSSQLKLNSAPSNMELKSQQEDISKTDDKLEPKN